MNKSQFFFHLLWILQLLKPLNLNAAETNSEHFQVPVLDYFKNTEPQIFRFWESLTADQQRVFENQLNAVDLKALEKQKQLILAVAEGVAASVDSFDDFSYSGSQEHILLGQDLIKRGEIGCLILAGGQGSRLQHSGPKGTFPVSIIRHKSLFQLAAEKVCAASAWAGRPLRLAIMTSPENDAETRLFFRQNHYFGLDPSQISFFTQGMLPLLDAQGKLFLKTPSEISTGPDGNGNSLLSLVESGILNEWIQEGVKFINVILVDNPLADPYDAELAGFHLKQNAEITLKCAEKFEPEEKVGVLVKKDGRCAVSEYSEMALSEKNKRREDGRLKHCCANLSLFCFSVGFIQRIACEKKTLPFHKAWKTAFYVDSEGHVQDPVQPIAWKFETFIFDWLVYTDKVAALLYPRKQCFAPLKNSSGADSPDTVRETIQIREREILRSLGVPPPDFPFELSADFYYPTDALKAKWRGRTVIDSYVEP